MESWHSRHPLAIFYGLPSTWELYFGGPRPSERMSGCCLYSSYLELALILGYTILWVMNMSGNLGYLISIFRPLQTTENALACSLDNNTNIPPTRVDTLTHTHTHTCTHARTHTRTHTHTCTHAHAHAHTHTCTHTHTIVGLWLWCLLQRCS